MTMAVTAGHWAFLYYIKHNPYKSVEAMTTDDLDAMAAMFRAANSDISTEAYTNALYPGAITAAATQAACDQANYPEKHKGS